MSAPIRVLLVDDHPVSLMGLVALLGSQPGFAIVAEAGSVAEAVVAHRLHRPDVALVDLRLPDGTGIDVITQVRAESPDARLIVLTGTDGEEHAYQALKHGASGYLMKSASSAELIHALREVVRGGRVVPAEIASAVAVRAGEADLTAREIQVLQLVAAGRTNNEIGIALSITLSTARTHVSSVLEKLGAADRAEATAIAIRRGIL